MRSLVFVHEKSYREILKEFAIILSKYLKKFILIFLSYLWRLLSFVAYAFFVPAKMYKSESPEKLAQEVHLREEYQKFGIPRGPFC